MRYGSKVLTGLKAVFAGRCACVTYPGPLFNPCREPCLPGRFANSQIDAPNARLNFKERERERRKWHFGCGRLASARHHHDRQTHWSESRAPGQSSLFGSECIVSFSRQRPPSLYKQEGPQSCHVCAGAHPGEYSVLLRPREDALSPRCFVSCSGCNPWGLAGPCRHSSTISEYVGNRPLSTTRARASRGQHARGSP